MSGEVGGPLAKPVKRRRKRVVVERQCSMCNVEFRSDRSFNDHLRFIHGVLKPYVCQTCAKCFPYSSSLYNHLKIHSSDRPFACTFCGSTFRWKMCLNYHLDCAHSKPPAKEGEAKSVITNGSSATGKCAVNRSRGSAGVSNGIRIAPKGNTSANRSRTASTVQTRQSSSHFFLSGGPSKNRNNDNQASSIRACPAEGAEDGSKAREKFPSVGQSDGLNCGICPSYGSITPVRNGNDQTPHSISLTAESGATDDGFTRSPSARQSDQMGKSIRSSMESVNSVRSGIDQNFSSSIHLTENGTTDGVLAKRSCNSNGRLLERVVSRLLTIRSEETSAESLPSKFRHNGLKGYINKSTQTEYGCPMCSRSGPGPWWTSQSGVA